MKIIGFSGTNGAGKDFMADMLGEHHGFYVASATDMLVAELKKRGWGLGREDKARLSAEWRREYGMAAIVDRAYDYFKVHQSEYKGMIVGSLRHPGEADRIHELGGQMVWVDADPRVRYDRIIANAHARGRAAEDDKTFEEFLAEQEQEMHPVGDAATLNMSAVKERSDIFIENNGNDKEVFKKAIEKQLAHLLN
jgi:dephospho-CoA kinase